MGDIRTAEERKARALELLASEADCWLPSANERGDAYLVPVSHYWDGTDLWLATPSASISARNLRRAGVVRLALGPTRDVVMVDGRVEFLPASAVDPAIGDAYVEHCGWDPRASDRNTWIRVTPTAIANWRTAEELPVRHVMKDGRWLV
jgi:hypothetical protein